MPTRSVFWAYLGVCALALSALILIPETVRNPDGVVSVRPRLGVAAYFGLGLPAVLTGLISVAVGPVDASAYIAGLVAAVVAGAFFVPLRQLRDC
jgi:hypothetical protein